MTTSGLAGKVAIVTGAGRGIGRSIATMLARHGAAVVLAARTRAQIDAVRREIEALGGLVACVRTDVRNEASVRALIRMAVQRFGRLDIVVNNAGIGIYGPLERTTLRQWNETMAVNATGPFLVCRAAIPYLRKQRQSSIVNIASVVAVKGYANQAAYGASKHAVLGMSKAMARELQEDGIRVHAICPGGVDTEMVSRVRPDIDKSELMQPDEVADVVLFLITRRGNAVVDQVDMRRLSSTPWA